MKRARLELSLDELPASDNVLAQRDTMVALLQQAAEQVASGADAGTLRDVHGNSVGHFIIWTRGAGAIA